LSRLLSIDIKKNPSNRLKASHQTRDRRKDEKCKRKSTPRKTTNPQRTSISILRRRNLFFFQE